jgi:hypothetical protein
MPGMPELIAPGVADSVGVAPMPGMAPELPVWDAVPQPAEASTVTVRAAMMKVRGAVRVIRVDVFPDGTPKTGVQANRTTNAGAAKCAAGLGPSHPADADPDQHGHR